MQLVGIFLDGNHQIQVHVTRAPNEVRKLITRTTGTAILLLSNVAPSGISAAHMAQVLKAEIDRKPNRKHGVVIKDLHRLIYRIAVVDPMITRIRRVFRRTYRAILRKCRLRPMPA